MSGRNTFPKFDKSGTSAIEFAMIAPLFFALVFGTLEVALIGWFSTLVAEGAEQGANYMRGQRMTGQPITDDGIRSAVCASVKVGGLSCDASLLKIGVFYAGVPVDNGFNVPAVIENYSDPKKGTGEQYIVAVGYNWGGMGLPTARIVLPSGSGGPQIQGRTYTVLSERLWEDGATP